MNSGFELPTIEDEREERSGAGAKIIKGIILLLVILLAAATVMVSLLYTRYVTAEDGRWVVDLTEAEWADRAHIQWLDERFPNADIHYMVELGGTRTENTVTSLTVTDRQGFTPEDIIAAAEELPRITELDMTGYSLSVEQYEALREAFPEASVEWVVPVSYGGGLEPGTISVRLTDIAQLRETVAVLDYLPNLHSIDMAGAVLSADETAELNELAPELETRGVEVVWGVVINGVSYPYDTAEIELAGQQGAQMLPELYRLPMLASVTLDGLPTGDLTPLISVIGLESVTIRNMDVEDITVLGRIGGLGSVFVKNTNVTQGQLNQLQERLPECIILILE